MPILSCDFMLGKICVPNVILNFGIMSHSGILCGGMLVMKLFVGG